MVNLVKEAGIPDWGGRLYQKLQVAFNSLSTPSTPILAANLPAPVSTLAGSRLFVKDATATTFYSIVSGGGADTVPVFCDGTDWRIG